MKTALILLILATALCGSAYGQAYLPLSTGNFWLYEAEDGAQELRVVTVQAPIFDGAPFGIEYSVSLNNQGLVNYWSSGEDGDVYLWGFYREGWGYLYDPPINILDAPLAAGKTWSTTVDFYTLPDTVYWQTDDIAYQVDEVLDLSVPAGDFPCYGIGSLFTAEKTLGGGRYTLWGELITGKTENTNKWFSRDVGIVQEWTDRIYRLAAYIGHPVRSGSSTWGEIKSLYR